MNRTLLRIIATLGLVITVMSGMGVFATFSDTANGGDDSVTSGERPRVADLQIWSGSLTQGVDAPIVGCADETQPVTWSEDLVTPEYAVTDAQPGAQWFSYVCLRNNGASALNLALGVADLASVETGCTGDEEAAGDTTCQPGEQGELAGLLWVDADEVQCTDANQVVTDNASNPLIQVSPVLSSSPLDAASIGCFRLVLQYVDVAETDAQMAQSDQVTWHFTFSGTAS